MSETIEILPEQLPEKGIKIVPIGVDDYVFHLQRIVAGGNLGCHYCEGTGHGRQQATGSTRQCPRGHMGIYNGD